MTPLIQRLRHELKRSNKSARQASLDAGYSHTYLPAVLRGTRLPRSSFFYRRIAQALDAAFEPLWEAAMEELAIRDREAWQRRLVAQNLEMRELAQETKEVLEEEPVLEITRKPKVYRKKGG